MYVLGLAIDLASQSPDDAKADGQIRLLLFFAFVDVDHGERASVRDGGAGQWGRATRDGLLGVSQGCMELIRYLLKPYRATWEDGFVALEGGGFGSGGADAGSGIGALVNLLAYKDSSDLFPTLRFPDTHNTPILKAAYVFSHLS